MRNSRQEEFQRAERRAKVQSLYLRRKSQREIATTLGVSQPTVLRDIEWIEEQWRTATVESIEADRLKQLQVIDNLMAEYWAGYERCLKGTTVQTDRVVTLPPDRPGARPLTRKEKTTRLDPPMNEATWLEGVRWCVAERCRIRGLYAPKKNEHTGEGGEPIQFRDVTGMTDAEVATELRRVDAEATRLQAAIFGTPSANGEANGQG